MSDYSGYQIKRAHALGPFASVYEATAPNGGPGRFALKVFHPPAAGNIRRAYAIEGFLLAAERQQKAWKKDGAVLEVLAFGRCAEGAYMVTPWQEHSLEPLAANLAAKGDLLRQVAELLLNTLEQWGAQTGGSHRKLKPANVFLARSGPLAGMTAMLSDPWFLLGAKSDTPRTNDLAAVGMILAQIVRRREVAAWPIEDAPEWKALGRAGKAWLAYVNFLMDPQPASGELTIAEARKRLRAIPKDANPVRTTLIVSGVAAVVLLGGLVAFARFGDPTYMPRPVLELAVKVKNPKAYREEVTESWALLCRAWDTWLADLQSSARRLNNTPELWAPNDPLKTQITAFLAEADQLRPERLVPEAAGKSLGTLANATPDNVREELRKITVYPAVDAAYDKVKVFAVQMERWQRWDELRTLLQLLEARNFTRGAAALRPRVPEPRGAGFKLETAIANTYKLFKELSLDTTGTLLLARRWNAITKLRTDMEGTAGDRVQNAMPRLILERLRDTGSLGNFAESLGEPLDELTRRRQHFLDPQVVRERFIAESLLLKETGDVTEGDFPRWEEELVLFSKVPAAEDPRLVQTLDTASTQLGNTAGELEADAPEGEAGQPETLNRATFDQELAARRAELAALRAPEIVRNDLPDVRAKTGQMQDRFGVLEARVAYTLTLLNPQTWLDKVRQAYGRFNETRQRWAAWQQAAVPATVTADSLRGAANREKFRGLRAQERQVKEFINGLEGPEGLAALTVPDLSGFTPETAAALQQLEAARREQAAAAASAAANWRDSLPTVTWASANVTVREPIEAHRQWLADLPAFATDLDRLAELLAGGFSWTEGVSDVAARLAPRAGLDVLTGRPGESVAESKLLGQLVESNDRGALVAAAQSGKLSRMLTAWRRLGAVAGWPANADDLDVDGGVVESLRKLVPETVRDESRRAGLLDELGRETRVRWNRAARNSAANIEQMSAVFERMAKYGISETDLEEEARANLFVWQFKRSDWGEVELPPLRARRDEFVAKMRALPRAMARPELKRFVDEIDGINLVADKNRPSTPTPKKVNSNWTEVMTDAGLGLTATWHGGGKTVKLEFSVIQPEGDLPPFYLARRAIAVGEFIDLMATAKREDVDAVLAAMPGWAVKESLDKPYNLPVAWRPYVAGNGEYQGFELNSSWFIINTSLVNGLRSPDPAAREKSPEGYRVVEQALSEAPTLRSPLQEMSPEAAKLFAEKILGARLPTPSEWQATVSAVGKPAAGNFRGPNFEALFKFLREYNEGGQAIPWRPNEGIFRPRVAQEGRKVPYPDDGRSSEDRDESRMWFTSVDEGPVTGKFINLTGNVSIYLQDGTNTFYVAGGSVLSPPGIDFTEPRAVEGTTLIGGKAGRDAFSDVGIRPAFEAPPGFKERFKLLELVRKQGFLTW